jgi:hypothetical protein
VTGSEAVVALAGVAVLVATAGRAPGREPGHEPGRGAVRFGGIGTAWTLRARSDSVLVGRWATRGWHATPVRLGTKVPGSLLIVGPTQSGKTTSLCAPLVAGWPGPVFAASVKGDLCGLTSVSRSARGSVWVVGPGVAGSASWDPVCGATTFARSRGLARDLTVGTGAGGGVGDQEFWATLSAKLLAPLLFSAHLAGGSIATVKGWVDRRDLDEPLEYLASHSEAADALVASFARDDRTLGSVLATVEAAIDALEATGEAVDPTALLDGANTCYLAAPLHDQRRYRPAFSGLLRQVLAAAATRADEGRHSGLLVLLDEAASIAPIEELDQIAATCQGQGVTLVTVWQDLAQLTARYGARARTLVNNHTSRVLFGGLADPTISEWLPALTGPSSGSRADSADTHVTVEELRQLPRGAALLVVGRHRPVRLVLRAPRRAPAATEGRAQYSSARGALRSLGSALDRRSDAPVRRAP